MLEKIGQDMVLHWGLVALHLGLPYEERNKVYDPDCKGPFRNDRERAVYVLRQWVARAEYQPTREHLKYALVKGKRCDLARRFMGPGKQWECGNEIEIPRHKLTIGI